MVAIKSLLLLATTASALLSPRQSSPILADLQRISSDAAALAQAAQAYKGGGLLNALPVQTAASKLQTDLQSATANAQESPALSQAQANQIVTFVTHQLLPNIQHSAQVVQSKARFFQQDGATSFVASSVQTLRSASSQYGNIVVSRLPRGLQPEGRAAVLQIDRILGGLQQTFG